MNVYQCVCVCELENALRNMRYPFSPTKIIANTNIHTKANKISYLMQLFSFQWEITFYIVEKKNKYVDKKKFQLT